MSKLADLSKAIQDLLVKPFSFDNKFEFKTKASNGVSFAVDAKQSDKGTVSTLTLSGKNDSGFSVDKFVVSSEKKINGEFLLSNFAANTDVTFKFADGSKTAGVDTTATVGGVLRTDIGTFGVDAEVITGPVFTFSALLKYGGYLFGTSAKYGLGFLGEDKKVKPGKCADQSVLLGYKADDFTVYLQGAKTEKGDTVEFSLKHDASSQLTAGFTSTLFLKDATKPLGVTFGGSYKIDDNTTVFGTTTEAAVVSLAYKSKVNQYATVTVSSKFDAAKLADQKFGLTLSLTN